MNLQIIKHGLAALSYYQSPAVEKGMSFEQLDEEKREVFLSLAGAILANLDKMNLTVVAKSTKNEKEVEAILRDRIEAEVKAFFDSIKIWKKGAIPQEELVSRIYAVWRNL